MSEFYPVVVQIEEIKPHPDPETIALELVEVNGYPVICRKGQFKIGDLAAYIPIDSVIPEHEPAFSFLKPSERKRLRAKKIRGCYSQGLLVEAPANFCVGDSVQEHFHLQKYLYPEELIELGLALPEGFRGPGDKSGSYIKAPTWAIPKFDLESLRKYHYIFDENEEVVLTEKLDGCYSFFRYADDQLWCKSRNYYKQRDPEDLWWEVALRLGFEESLRGYSRYGFAGEIYGNVTPFHYDSIIINGKIQKQFALFDVYDFEESKFVDYDESMRIAKELNMKVAPLIYRGPWKSDKSLFTLAENDTLLTPTIDKATKISEGFVIKPVIERFKYPLGRVIAKLKAEKYNMAK